MPDSNAFVFVTADRQTAVASQSSSIRLDWLRWVREELGESSGAANYTIYRTLIDESGNEIVAREVLNPTPDGLISRITVKTNASTNEFYVQIAHVVVYPGAEDPDRAIYELEACVPQPGGEVDCFSSNLTVYAIGQPPILIFARDDGKVMWSETKRLQLGTHIDVLCDSKSIHFKHTNSLYLHKVMCLEFQLIVVVYYYTVLILEVVIK